MITERHRDNWARPVAAMMLGKYGGLTQRDVADAMGLNTGAAVSLQVRKLKESLATTNSLLMRHRGSRQVERPAGQRTLNYYFKG